MIIGVGNDLCNIERIQRSLDRFGARFEERVFTPYEIAKARGRRRVAETYAKRFAAKEAVSKCFTTGIGEHLEWTSVSVYHGTRHEPLVRLDAKAQALLEQVGATHVMLTLSHIDTHAMAVAALVRH